MAKIDLKPNSIMVACGVFGCNTPAKWSIGNAGHSYERLLLCDECKESMATAFGAEPESVPAPVQEQLKGQIDVDAILVEVEEIPPPAEEVPHPEEVPEVQLDKSDYAVLSRTELVKAAAGKVGGKNPLTMKSAEIVAALKEWDDAH